MKFFLPLSSLILIITLPLQALSSDLIIFLKSKSCMNCDLSFSDLNYSILRDGDLSGSNLSYLNASRSSFFNYSFRNANLTRANFSHAKLVSSDFTDTIFDNTVFFETVVTNSIFDYSSVPYSIIKNSVDFPIHLLPKERINTLLSTTSPETHPRFYLSLLEHVKSLSPDDPSITLLLAHFFYKYQFDYELSISYLQDASSQFLSLNQPQNSAKVMEISKLMGLRLQESTSFTMPDSKGNGLGISAVNNLKDLFSNLLPTLTSLSSLVR